MKLQVAIDTVDPEEAIYIADMAVLAGADILEIGTPLITSQGASIVRLLAKRHPGFEIYADIKLIDFPELELGVCFDAGATSASVMMFASDENVQRAINIATSRGCRLFFSSMGYPLQLLACRTHRLVSLGAKNVIAHGSGESLHDAFADMQSRAREIQRVSGVLLSVGGGITLADAVNVAAVRPEVVIVGRAVTKSADLRSAVASYKALLETNV